MKYKKIALFLTLFVILLFLKTNYTSLLINNNTNLNSNNNVTIDFKKNIGTINMEYGANEDDNWVDFANSDEIHNLHKEVNSEYIRVWVSSPSYRKSTIPLQEDGAYNFTNLDLFINAVLKSDAIPFLVFAHAPGTYGEGHGNLPPEDDEEFADYVEAVVKHYIGACQNNRLKPCNVDEWYFEIWNEPYTEEWWQDEIPRYTKLFNIVHSRIKDIAPNARVGGYTGAYFDNYENNQRAEKFLKNTDADFISIHHYGNTANAYTDGMRMKNIRLLMYDAMISLRKLAVKCGKSDIEIINSEYNSDSTVGYMPHLDEQFTAAWYASALIWQIKSQEVSLEIFYSGTSNREDGGFGMWSPNGTLFPAGYLKKSFVKYNKKGSSIFDTASSNDFIDILAVENDDEKFVTVVNKINQNNLITMTIIDGNEIIDLGNNEKFNILNDGVELSLKPYEVKFLTVN